MRKRKGLVSSRCERCNVCAKKATVLLSPHLPTPHEMEGKEGFRGFGDNDSKNDLKGDLKSRIREVSDRISLNKSADTAQAYRLVSSSIGSETPLGVLAEIREGQTRMIEEIKGLAGILQEAELRTEQRHRETCTILLGIAELGGGGVPPGTETVPAVQAETRGTSRSCSYYGSHAITNGTYLVACVLMHIDSMLQSHPVFKKIQNRDSTFMDIKDWYVVCGSAFNADKVSKVGLRIPKPTDEDFRSAVRMMASPVCGRRPVCEASHLSLLLASCPALMTTVEWMRVTLLKCAGVLSPERTCRFRRLSHPFVSEASELLVDEASTLKLPNKWLHQDVLSLKVTARKEYMRLVLEESLKPMDAIGKVKVK